MTSRVLVAEFQGLFAEIDTNSNLWQQVDQFEANYRIPRFDGKKLDGCFVSETTIDLTGYVLDDLTVYFRKSFEQLGGYYLFSWPNAGVLATTALLEQTIISSIPLSDDNIVSIIASESPGFLINGGWTHPTVGLKPGTFDRTHIIHGHQEVHVPSSIMGSDALTEAGSGYPLIVSDNYYSSLEPTAADCLYCYRILLTNGAEQGYPLKTFSAPAKRVILDCMTDKEPYLEYMMRLARSYELANQV